MAINDVELTKQYLIDLNKRIGEMEQEQGAEAHKFFNAHLSDQLIFRRASAKVVGKSEPEGFLDSLKKPSAFTSRVSEDISVALLGNRALVTLIVVGTRAVVPLGAIAISDCSPDPETTGFLSFGTTTRLRAFSRD